MALYCYVVLSLLVNIQFQVLFHSPPGVLFTVPSRYYSLSVTKSYLGFGDGPPIFTQDFTCPTLLWILIRLILVSLTRLLLCVAYLSRYVQLQVLPLLTESETPQILLPVVWPVTRSFATTKAIVVYFLFLQVLRWFSSLSSLHNIMYSCYDTMTSSQCVSTFGDLRIIAHLQLPAAYRSQSRPSSAFSAKAFSICSLQLDRLFVPLINVLWQNYKFEIEIIYRCKLLSRICIFQKYAVVIVLYLYKVTTKVVFIQALMQFGYPLYMLRIVNITHLKPFVNTFFKIF